MPQSLGEECTVKLDMGQSLSRIPRSESESYKVNQQNITFNIDWVSKLLFAQVFVLICQAAKKIAEIGTPIALKLFARFFAMLQGKVVHHVHLIMRITQHSLIRRDIIFCLHFLLYNSRCYLWSSAFYGC